MSTKSSMLWELEELIDYVYFDHTECEKIALSIEPNLSDMKQLANTTAVFMCLNSWFNLIDDLNHPYVGKLLRLLLVNGYEYDFTKFMDRLDRAVESLLPSLTWETVVGDDGPIHHAVAQAWPELYMALDWDKDCREVLSDILVILRYPKRMAPPYTPHMSNDAIVNYFKVDAESLAVNNNTSDPWLYPSDNFEVEHWYLISWLNDIVNELPWPDSFNYSIDEFHVPSGSTGNTCNNPLCKNLGLHVNAKSHGYADENPLTPFCNIKVDEQVPGLISRNYLNIQGSTSENVLTNLSWSTVAMPMRIAKPTAVPKSFKTCRIIAPCEVQVYSEMTQFANQLREILDAMPMYWHGCITMDDQSVSREAAKSGSISGMLSTIDASGGSDRIKKRVELCYAPRCIREVINRCEMYLTDGTYVKRRFDKVPTLKQIKLCHMVAPSGNPFTFPNECFNFGALHELAYRIYEQFTGIDDLEPWYVCGDDGICDSRVYELLCELYEIFGLKVNALKSYGGDSLFKESCGGEYFYGWNLNPFYFPRKPWIHNPERLMSFNNNAYEYFKSRGISGSRTLTFIRLVIRCYYPQAQFTPEDLLTDGLVGEQFLYSLRTSPYGFDGIIEHYDNMQLSSVYSNGRVFPVNTVTKDYYSGDRKINARCACKLLSNEMLKSWYDYQSYYDFLQFGPRYDSPLDKLLGVTSKRLSADQCLVGEERSIMFKNV